MDDPGANLDIHSFIHQAFIECLLDARYHSRYKSDMTTAHWGREIAKQAQAIVCEVWCDAGGTQ